ncbi:MULTISPECIES: nucleotidyltransferase family protein [Gordonibacter]|uniref:Nucleotidyltransferase domain-containing protein n=1 Tax=Gordonibacter faecis TaxID=3047475 RepID=A0ABT7DIZ7_9ACTN|nr:MULTISPECIES: nucleotidyltransferase domain-containing protein [unclassified Gordonibacter]MDJ1649497.1 nucleotidyltransferase domain-containing protein [Gordonibacter sp. KGMB12511]HIW76347.1 nucleotidyltransferase domain-containing protein [Candidatus Gordonibacter avicola]
MLDIPTITKNVSETVRDYPVRKIDLFGSYARNDQTDASDVDLLVEFTSLAVSLLTISSLRMQLEEKLGVPVDLLHAPLPEDSFLEIGETVTLYER